MLLKIPNTENGEKQFKNSLCSCSKASGCLSLLFLRQPPLPDTLTLVCIVFQINFNQSKPSPTRDRNNMASGCFSCASNHHHTLTWPWFASFYNSNQSHQYHQPCMARQAHKMVSGCISCASNPHHAQTPLPWLAFTTSRAASTTKPT